MSEVSLAENLKVLKEFFCEIPRSGNQINIIIVGNTADLKEEINILKDAVRLTVQERNGARRGDPSIEAHTFQPEKETTDPYGIKRNMERSPEWRKKQSESMKKRWAERRAMKKDG